MRLSPFSAFGTRAATMLLLVGGLGGCHKSSSSDSAPAATTSAINQGLSLESFEGEIGLSIKPGTPSHEAKAVGPFSLNIQVKNGKVRIDAPNDVEQLKGLGRMYAVIAAPEKKIFAVLDDKKEIVSLDLDKLGERMKSMKPPGQPQQKAPASTQKPPTVVKTMHADNVAGHLCYDWDIIASGGKATLCVAEQGVPWLSVPTQNLPAEHAWLSQILDGRHFPLRVIAFENGQEAGRVEVTKLEKKTLPAQLFKAPAGYRSIELEQAIQEIVMSSMNAAGVRPGVGNGLAKVPPLPPEIAARIKAAQEKRDKAH